MRKLVFLPSDPISAYLEKGKSYQQLEEYYNPGGFFDEVYCLSPWGEKSEEVIGRIHYLKAEVLDFRKIIKKIHPDVVRAYGGYCCADWISISKVKGIPCVVSVHDTNPDLIYDSLKYADALICMSSAVKDSVLEKVNITHNNIFIMGNRVDTEIFKRKNNSEFFSALDKKYGTGKHILHIGRKTEQKNLDTVIKALQYLEDYSCVFIGKGDDSKYQEMAQEYHCANRCFFEQSVKNIELPYWYSWSNYFVVPSRWEGFGVVFIEAAACESIIISSDISPMNEFLENNNNSILLKDYENPDTIVKAIRELEKDKEKTQMIKTNARKVALKFSKETIDKEETAIYQKVISIAPNNRNNIKLRKKMELNYYGKSSRIGVFNIKIKAMIKRIIRGTKDE